MSGIIGSVGSKSGLIGETEPIISEIDSWRFTTTQAGNQSPVSANLERTDVNFFVKRGAGMTHSSGIFSYPRTGIWRVSFQWYGYSQGNNRYIFAVCQSSSDSGSNYNTTAVAKTQISDIGEYGHNSCFCQGYLNVTDISTYRTKFIIDVDGSGSAVSTQGSSGENNTYMLFERVARSPYN